MPFRALADMKAFWTAHFLTKDSATKVNGAEKIQAYFQHINCTGNRTNANVKGSHIMLKQATAFHQLNQVKINSVAFSLQTHIR